MKPSIGLPERQLKKSTQILSILLSDEMTLYVKTRKFHWNVFGDNFMELHKLFQAQYTETEATIDLIAERINKLGAATIGTMKEFASFSRLKESAGKNQGSKAMLKELLMDHETIVKYLRMDIHEGNAKSNDTGTMDILTGIMEQHESAAWVLRRYLS